jgi:hypothetical protein
MMATSNTPSTRMHDALHRLPGIPAHSQAAELNSNDAAARLHHRSLQNRPPHNQALRNRPLPNPDGHHARPPRVLTRWQAWIGQLFGQGQ